MDLLLTKRSKIERALSCIKTRGPGKNKSEERTPMTGPDDNDIFDAQHLTGQDIEKLEEALSADDLDVVVAAVDAIVGQHLNTLKKSRR